MAVTSTNSTRVAMENSQPPRALITFFAVVVSYVTYRLLMLEHPSWAEAKFSEWPEMCFAAALALWCADIGAGVRPSLGHLLSTKRSI